MTEEKYISIFPYNMQPYFHNAVFDAHKNKGIEATIFTTLKKYLKQKNININTYDIDTPQAPYRYVYFDLPYFWNLRAWKKILFNRNKNILLCNEPPLVNPFDYFKIFHSFFTKVYTWNDDMVDGKKYFKVCLPKSSADMVAKPKSFKKKFFLVLINGNKKPFYPFQLLSSFGTELYSERIKSIEFFESTRPGMFTLYGRGWNKPKKYNLSEWVFGYKKYRTYKGEVKDKISVLSNFKYSLCFENLTNVKGYITEKIFDCFRAKCVPVYWGATNIEIYIPKNCFIDYRDFGSYEKLLHFLESIDENAYNAYVRNIERLLSDRKFKDMWFEQGFARFFLEDILEMKNEQI